MFNRQARTALTLGAVLQMAGAVLPGAARAEAPIHLFNLLSVKPQAEETFLAAMRDNARLSRKEPGAISFDVFKEESGGSTLYLLESWKGEAGLEAHGKTEHIARVIGLAKDSLAAPETSYRLVDAPGAASHQRQAVPDAATTRNVIVRLVVKPEGRDAFVKAVAEVVPQARKAPGNYVFDLYQQSNDPNAFVVFERWKDVASHEAHLKAGYSLKLDEALPATLAGKPDRYLLRDVAP